MSSNEIISQAILARMATQNYQVKQLAKDLGTTREATGRRLNQHTIWDSNELDIVGKALGLTDMFGLCDYARALAEMNKNVPYPRPSDRVLRKKREPCASGASSRSSGAAGI